MVSGLTPGGTREKTQTQNLDLHQSTRKVGGDEKKMMICLSLWLGMKLLPKQSNLLAPGCCYCERSCTKIGVAFFFYRINDET